MFTGLVHDIGRVGSLDASDRGARLTVRTALTRELRTGDSVAVNGVCLTASDIRDGAFAAEAMNETLKRTSLGDLQPGAEVNLELALRAGDRLGGHVVQGHVDGLGTVATTAGDGFARRLTISAPEEVLRYLVHKGSVAVDGVSLTVAALDDRSFTVSLIPETLERTTLGGAQPGTRVNLEVDVFSKYVEKAVRAITGAP
ncbi:MAG: riboflavin synthase [Solirubrobacterales bacterium]|nr:riboflavin synthase [Solirubrobacterales bacterium]MBV9715801.1 riboflavin synthase [Solirubrobacterales bacterium]